ncbi:hypothetical protein E0493_22735 [Roseomonas sp. M0104]|uniref:Secreted protein n=1 Tax=Teichococcus coralli TaxID=2545983 RepID=A0A845BGW4_9PROT|nr:hypothetical protein [Pseudoroseomonas coralli]MXP66148.1 hypothetical protein [Pseudoroseomonas coralli]
MKLSRCLQASLIVLATVLGFPARAETATEVINGATCIPYPPNDSTSAVPYQHWLYVFREIAFCHITMPPGWSVDDLSYVLFNAALSSGTLTARLCVHSGTFTVTCGAPRTLSAGATLQWVQPPVVPSSASGAFVQLQFPRGSVSSIRQLVPVWIR